jgi:hypothetical protein
MVGAMASERALSRCRERLDALSESSVDSDALRREAITYLQKGVGFDRWCWPLADPETLIASSGLAEHNYGPGVPRSLELEYSVDGFAAKHVLARRAAPVGSLNLETGGDVARSARWDEVLRPAGIGDVATVACRDAHGCWGWIELYRDSADRPFDERELSLLESIAPATGSALRRHAMQPPRGEVEKPGPPGTLVLDRDLRPVSWTTGARAWIDALPSAQLFASWGMLPSVVYPTAVLARTGADAHGARALVQAVDGRWVTIEAAALEGEREAKLQSTSGLQPPTRHSTCSVACTRSRNASGRWCRYSSPGWTRAPSPTVSSSPPTRCRTT